MGQPDTKPLHWWALRFLQEGVMQSDKPGECPEVLIISASGCYPVQCPGFIFCVRMGCSHYIHRNQYRVQYCTFPKRILVSGFPCNTAHFALYISGSTDEHHPVRPDSWADNARDSFTAASWQRGSRESDQELHRAAPGCNSSWHCPQLWDNTADSFKAPE